MTVRKNWHEVNVADTEKDWTNGLKISSTACGSTEPIHIWMFHRSRKKTKPVVLAFMGARTTATQESESQTNAPTAEVLPDEPPKCAICKSVQ